MLLVNAELFRFRLFGMEMRSNRSLHRFGSFDFSSKAACHLWSSIVAQTPEECAKLVVLPASQSVKPVSFCLRDELTGMQLDFEGHHFVKQYLWNII